MHASVSVHAHVCAISLEFDSQEMNHVSWPLSLLASRSNPVQQHAPTPLLLQPTPRSLSLLKSYTHRKRDCAITRRDEFSPESCFFLSFFFSPFLALAFSSIQFVGKNSRERNGTNEIIRWSERRFLKIIKRNVFVVKRVERTQGGIRGWSNGRYFSFSLWFVRKKKL